MRVSPEYEAVILYIGQRFHVDVIAGGVEPKQQSQALQEMGRLQGQGYLFGKPISARDFSAQFLAANAASALGFAR